MRLNKGESVAVGMLQRLKNGPGRISLSAAANNPLFNRQAQMKLFRCFRRSNVVYCYSLPRLLLPATAAVMACDSSSSLDAYRCARESHKTSAKAGSTVAHLQQLRFALGEDCTLDFSLRRKRNKRNKLSVVFVVVLLAPSTASTHLLLPHPVPLALRRCNG